MCYQSFLEYRNSSSVTMERSRNGALMRSNSQDYESLESVEELYFGERETEEKRAAQKVKMKRNSCIEMGEAELSEKEKIEKFIVDTSKCKLEEQGAACSTILSRDDFYDRRNNCQELSSAELDLVILGVIQSSLHCGDVSLSGRKGKHRERTRMVFFYHGRRICKETFLFLHSASRTRFCSLVKHYKTNGLTLRVQGNSKRLPSSASSIETVENVVKFIMNIAVEQWI